MFVKFGSRGDAVVEVQELLKAHGYEIATDGIFGKDTKKVVISYQKTNGLSDDGIVGNGTYKKLLEGVEIESPKDGTPWLDLARSEIGVHEVHNESRVHFYWKKAKLSGLAKHSASKIPWCSGFVCAMMEMADIRSARTDGAKNWLNWGIPLDKPYTGCVVVFTRSGGGHVGIVVGEDESGNQIGRAHV